MGVATGLPRAHHVGSLLRPPALMAAQTARAAGTADARELRRREDAAIRDAVAMQEKVGLPVVTDGELRRMTWNFDFLSMLDNVEFAEHPETRRPQLEVRGPVARSTALVADDLTFLRDTATVPVKITMPSPSYLLGTRGVYVRPDAYEDPAGLAADVVRAYRAEIAALERAGCRHLQFDDPNFGFFCDERWRAQAEEASGRPWEAMLELYVTVINAALAQRSPDLTVMLHTCRGNVRDIVLARGDYEPVADRLFNDVAVDGYLLEYDDERSGSFAPLRHLPKGKLAVLGLTTTRSGVLEVAAGLKRRIEEAARFAPIEQLALSPQCGFASPAEGDRLTAGEQRAKLERIVDVAADVWA
jgi:5-methyltetrahydropteroyltriglutamate--homocysteine methyltransferase